MAVSSEDIIHHLAYRTALLDTNDGDSNIHRSPNNARFLKPASQMSTTGQDMSYLGLQNAVMPPPPHMLDPSAQLKAAGPSQGVGVQNPRKRRASGQNAPLAPAPPMQVQYGEQMTPVQLSDQSMSEQVQQGQPTPKKGRTNTPWTPGEEQRLKQMRDHGKSWSEIAKTFPNRTEGSVKKHWYKDMHYAEFDESESTALLAAIKEYDANKWKVIGQKLGKPAKACEQFAKQNFNQAK